MTATAPPPSDVSRPLGLIGGSGLYSFLPDAEEVTVQTPYGPPSAPVSVGTAGGRRVAFLPRHGTAHEHPPHTLNYRANLWALASLGVRQVVAACAVGGLSPATPPGTFVVPDQLVDRTSGRRQTYVERGAVHVPFADPYCPELRAALLGPGGGAVDGGTMVVIEGPRFSTRAESRWYAAQGWSLVGMTGHPEAVLARELGLCYATIALVTDLDAGLTESEAVDQATVLAVFAANTDRLRGHLTSALDAVTGPTACRCRSWQDDVTLTFDLP